MLSQHNQTEAAHVGRRAAGRDAVRARERRVARAWLCLQHSPGKKNIRIVLLHSDHNEPLVLSLKKKKKRMAHERRARIVAALTAACVCAVWAGRRDGGDMVLVPRADAAAAPGKLLSRRKMNEMSLRALRGEHEMLEKRLAQVLATYTRIYARKLFMHMTFVPRCRCVYQHETSDRQ